MANTEIKNILYLPSTPLNLLVSVAHAVEYSIIQNAQLVLIDQKKYEDNLYFKALKDWKSSPFQRVELTEGVAKRSAKLSERKFNFLKLGSLVEDFPADVVAVGSDRRIEFQYVMYLRSQGFNQVEGWYLDDGLYTYAGRPYHWFGDGINGLLKKIAYGFWWKEPKTVGASSWIKQAWLFSPENAVLPIQNKICHEIQSDWFLSPKVSQFIKIVLKEFNLSDSMRDRFRIIDVFILIPHPNNILKMSGYISKLEGFLKSCLERGIKVAIKYHPRSEGTDFLNLEIGYGVLILPSELAFEFLIPLLGSKTVILGDVSTVLMTAKWLRPDITSLAVLDEGDPFAQKFKGVISMLGILIIPDFKFALRVLKNKSLSGDRFNDGKGCLNGCGVQKTKWSKLD